VYSAAKLDWLEKDLAPLSRTRRGRLCTRALWMVYPKWGWGTDDGVKGTRADEAFRFRHGSQRPYSSALQKIEGNMTFHTARSTAFPQPEAGTAPSRDQWLSKRRSCVVSRTDECVPYVENHPTLAVVDSHWHQLSASWIRLGGEGARREHAFSVRAGTLLALFDGAAFLAREPVDRARAARGWLLDNPARRIQQCAGNRFGLVMTKGSLLGHGALRNAPPVCVPAFALLVALATWRVLVGSERRDWFSRVTLSASD